MPARAPSRCPCGVSPPRPACSARVEPASGKYRRRGQDIRRPTAAARGYGPKWQEARREFLTQPENHICARCKAAPASIVHHATPHRLGHAKTEAERTVALKTFWRRSNWMAVCQKCHDGPLQREERCGQ